MSSADFVHLHLHSEYSLLDGAIRFEKLGEYLTENGMDTVAVTDHGSMFGAVHFCDRMKEAGVKPIIGSEIYLTPGSRTEKKIVPGRVPYYHLIVLAADEEGYRNLVKLSSAGFVEGFYYKPRIDRELLERHCGGLVIGSACLQGEVARALLKGNRDKAMRAVEYYQELVGGERFFIELMDHGLEDEKRILEGLADIAAATSALPVATNDAHYLRREDAAAHEALLCLQTGKTLNDPSRMRFTGEEFYVKTPEEMAKLFSWLPEAVGNSRKIADLCDFSVSGGDFLLPRAPMPEGYRDQGSYLRDMASEGLASRLGRKPEPAEVERLEHELDIIINMGFPGYFIIVSELMRWAKNMKIPVGPGRGSAAGSLVSYAVDITDVNPLEFDLSFERFLNPARAQMPDIDLDVCVERRGEIIDHLKELYGEDSVCQIITFSRMKMKAVVKDIARVLGMSYSQGETFTKLVSEADDDQGLSLKELVKSNKPLAEMVSSTPGGEKLIAWGDTLMGLARHAGVHAAGVVITPGRLDSSVPLYWNREKGVTTQYEMKSAEKIGLLKLDVLGLRTVTVIHHAEQAIRNRIPDFSIETVPMDDKKTLQIIGSGETTAVFQLESAGMREALKKIGVSSLDDVTAAVAIYRPGSMHMIDHYGENKRKAGRGERIKYLHPALEDVLGTTYGVIIYQEQVMRIAGVLAGMSMADADNLRRAMSKKIAGKMAVMKDVFLKGSEKNGIRKALEIWDLIKKFAEYGFNKSHAVCYAIIAYRTAYLKAHYPAEFMAAVLTSEIGTVSKLRSLIKEAVRLGVQVKPPSVNHSSARFTAPEPGEIRYGLAAIKNVGFSSAEEIKKAADSSGGFTTIFDLCAGVALLEGSTGLNRRTLESLIHAGATDCLEGSRAQQLQVMEKAISYASALRQNHDAGQMSLFGGGGEQTEPAVPPLPDIDEMSLEERLQLEGVVLGFYFSGHPLDAYREEVAGFTSHSLSMLESASPSLVTTAGAVVDSRRIETRRGPMAFITVADRETTVELVMFEAAVNKYWHEIEKGALLLFEAEVMPARGDRGQKVSVNRVTPLARSRARLRAGVNINTDGFSCDTDTLKHVEELCRNNRGKGNLSWTVRFPGRTVNLSSRGISVDPSDEFMEELRKVLPETAEVTLSRGDGR
ncbi:DNA polymerase III subunit alpha [Candidatus Fermentibacteria bacterium]|nr:MAG: DNA polymerase III subunit alpha [Candidatus Fermentibacteria bacterium]